MSHLYSGRPRNETGSGKTLLATPGVARIFSVHPSTVRRWCRQGKIKAYRVGRRGNLRFKREDVAIAYLDRGIRHCLDNM